MAKIHSFPKIFAVGSDHIPALFRGPVDDFTFTGDTEGKHGAIDLSRYPSEAREIVLENQQLELRTEIANAQLSQTLADAESNHLARIEELESAKCDIPIGKEREAVSEKMKITKCFTVKCCDRELGKFDNESDAVTALYRHVRRAHKRLFARLERKARLSARSQNGCGYWDSNQTNGWARAGAGFREAWCRSELIGHLTGGFKSL